MIAITDCYNITRRIDPASVLAIRPYHGNRSVLWVNQGAGQPTLIVIIPMTEAEARDLFQEVPHA